MNLTTKEAAALEIARDLVRFHGFTPCDVTGFVEHGRAFAFSKELVGNRSINGPSFQVVTDLDGRLLHTVGTPRPDLEANQRDHDRRFVDLF